MEPDALLAELAAWRQANITDVEDIQACIEAGLDAASAAPWTRLRPDGRLVLYVDVMQHWTSHGVRDPAEACLWSVANVQPRDAAMWKALAYTAEQINEVRDHLVNGGQSRFAALDIEWGSTGFRPRRMALCILAGLSPQEAPEHRDTPDDVLRALAALRQQSPAALH